MQMLHKMWNWSYRGACKCAPQSMGTRLPHKTSIQAKRMYWPLPRQTTAEGRLLALGQFVSDQTLWQMIIDVKDKLITLIATEMWKEIKLIKCHCFCDHIAKKKSQFQNKQGKAQASSSSTKARRILSNLQSSYRCTERNETSHLRQ